VLASEATGASMFIAAFVAGLSTQAGFSEVGEHSVEFPEEWGQLFKFFCVLPLRLARHPVLDTIQLRDL
jgi:hypothetical protein